MVTNLSHRRSGTCSEGFSRSEPSMPLPAATMDCPAPGVSLLSGSFLVATVAVFARSRIARNSALTAGTVVLIWSAVQVAIIGYVSWMQPATTIGGLLILLLAWMLPSSGAPPYRAR